MNSPGQPIVGIVMGSDSDLPTMSVASTTLDEFEIAHEVRVVSAHRTVGHMVEYGRTAAERGLRVIIAGAGGSAHLPGMLASLTTLPVLGVAVESRSSDPLSSATGSQVRMPAGKPLAFLGTGQAAATNAALLAVRILALGSEDLVQRLAAYNAALSAEVMAKDQRLQELGPRGYLDAVEAERQARRP